MRKSSNERSRLRNRFLTINSLVKIWQIVYKSSTTIAERYLDGQKDVKLSQINIYGRQLVFQMANHQSTSGSPLYLLPKHVRFSIDYENSLKRIELCYYYDSRPRYCHNNQLLMPQV